jgi:hypothetical protein
LAAALPLYLALGGSKCYLLEWGLPQPWALWPFRLAAPVWWREWAIEPTPAGIGLGALMFLTDAAAIWAAAHWGAAYGVRAGGIALAVAYLAGRTLWTVLVSALALGAISAAAVLVFLVLNPRDLGHAGSPAALGVEAFYLLAYGLLWWKHFLPRAGRLVLEEFANFDRLADEDFRPRHFRGFSVWRDDGERP